MKARHGAPLAGAAAVVALLVSAGSVPAGGVSAGGVSTEGVPVGGGAAAYTDTVAYAETASPAPPDRTAPALPEPSGDRPVGLTTLHLKDADRADPWVPEERRELMVSLWYPARKPSGTPAPYMTAEESKRYVAANRIPVPPTALSEVTTHATVGAKPAPAPGGLPLVVLSPGFGMPRATLTGLAEELASRGYVVAAVGHNYEADGISFPDGRTTSCVACANRDYPKVGAVRAADVSFVLDKLTGRAARDTSGPAPAEARHRALLRKGGPRIDTRRVAMAGHSAGGFSTIPAMLRDTRIKAAVNMDGNYHFPNDIPVDRPLLMLGRPSHVPGGPDGTWDETWTELTGWKRWLTVDGIEHNSLTDLASLAEQFDIPLQDLDGDRSDAIVRGYVTAFLDTHLRGRETPLLEGPSARYPEVRFHTPRGLG
ncbi:alpha/beta hydrolase family protein [Streptomyces sp. NPDC127108]|uniref:alpha/beta hydrolase family protein n=1 Tax=Streptomyces sp. NPDC127108 TaxID=3345361 RepID=UPI003625EFCB